MNFADAESRLGNRSSRKVGNNTYLHRINEDTIAVRLHFTDVVTWHRNNPTVLTTGGWRTPTTKDRINGYSPAKVYSEKGKWYVWWNDQKAPFFDGINVDDNGIPLQIRVPDPADEKAEKQMLKRITKYVKEFAESVAKPGFPLPTKGDCWECLFVNKNGVTWGDMHPDQEHIISHMDENYFVPSLLLNALKEKKYRDPMFIFQIESGSGRPSATIRTALRSYLKRRLLPNSSGARPIATS